MQPRTALMIGEQWFFAFVADSFFGPRFGSGSFQAKFLSFRHERSQERGTPLDPFSPVVRRRSGSCSALRPSSRTVEEKGKRARPRWGARSRGISRESVDTVLRNGVERRPGRSLRAPRNFGLLEETEPSLSRRFGPLISTGVSKGHPPSAFCPI